MKLIKNSILSPTTQVNISFHVFRWQEKNESVSLEAGGNIIYHSLSAATSTHHHEFPEMIVVLKGKVRHVINNEADILDTGSIVFIRPDDRHCFEQHEDVECELIDFAFSLDILEALTKFLECDFFLRSFTASALPSKFQLSKPELEEFDNEALLINSLEITDPVMAKLKARSIISDFFLKFFTSPISQKADYPEWLDGLCNKMRKITNFESPLKTMRQLAPCTPEHLCWTFKKYLNKTPTDFINELRVIQAARMLLESNDKIYSIALDIGIKSPSRFNAVFKNYYGIPPAKYRQVHKANTKIMASTK